MTLSARAALAAVAAAAFLTASAPADTAAHATLGPLSVTLTDLAPGDGITPSIVFAPSTSYAPMDHWYTDATSAKAAVYQAQYGDSLDITHYGTATWDPISAATSKPLATANASVSGSRAAGDGGSAMLDVSGTSTTPFSLISSDYTSYTAQSVAPNYYGYFTLSPNTSVTFSGRAEIMGWAQAQASLSPDYAEASARISIAGPNPSGSGTSQAANDMIDLLVQPRYADGRQSFDQTQTLSQTFVNLTSADMTGSLRLYIEVYGYSYAAAPAPEPTTAAILLAGLALLGRTPRHPQTPRRKPGARPCQ